MSIYLSGIGVSKGIAIGKAFIIARELLDAKQVTLSKAEIEPEIDRFEKALGMANRQLNDIKQKIARSTANDIVA